MSLPIPNPYFGGLRTVIYPVVNLAAASAWYSSILGIPPHFNQPFYVGFNVSGYELGLQPESAGTINGLAGSVAYWGVLNAQIALDRLVSLGATVQCPVEDVGGNIKIARVFDPFGNIFGIIQNPNFVLPAA